MSKFDVNSFSTEDIIAEARSMTLVQVPVVSSLVDTDKQARLAQAKREIGDLVHLIEPIMFKIVGVFERIQKERLYEGAWNERTGAPYATMQEYEPHLLKELQAEYGVPGLSVRTVRDYLTLDRVFVDNGLATQEEILELGPTLFNQLRKGMAYDSRTGAIREEEGKLTVQQAREIIDMAKDADGQWSMQSTGQLISDFRGEHEPERAMTALWEHSPHLDTYRLVGLKVWEDGEFKGDVLLGKQMTRELAEWVARKLGVRHNLDEV